MLKRLDVSSSIKVFNRARPATKILGSFFVSSAFLWVKYCYLLLRLRPGALYVGLSGGTGQLIDSLFVIVARMAGLHIWVHHHSFAYIIKRNWISRYCLSLLK